MHGGKPWVTDHRHWNFEAAKRATKVRLANLLVMLIYSYVILGRV